MPEHGYQQYCGAARALDVVGDRWTLLIVRELMLGPRRFTDLLDGLPGISRNLLTERLRTLGLDGVITRAELPPPAARQVYELTEDGRGLANAMIPLVAWGATRLGARKPGETFRAHWAALAMNAFADRQAASGVRENYQYEVGGKPFYFTVADGAIELHGGRAPNPVVTLATDDHTWADMASGATTASAAARTGKLTLIGDRQAVKRMARIFSRTTVLAQAEHIVKVAKSPRRSPAGSGHRGFSPSSESNRRGATSPKSGPAHH